MPRPDEDEFLSLIGRIYDTTLDPTTWPAVLQSMVEAHDSMGAYMYLMDGKSGNVVHGVSAGLPEDESDGAVPSVKARYRRRLTRFRNQFRMR